MKAIVSLKNKEQWIQHLKNVKSKNGTIYDAVNFNFEFECLPANTY